MQLCIYPTRTPYHVNNILQLIKDRAHVHVCWFAMMKYQVKRTSMVQPCEHYMPNIQKKLKVAYVGEMMFYKMQNLKSQLNI
jgi:hypothetical protein